MGMFDYVKYRADCFLCGGEITGWQTKSAKDDDCLMRRLQTRDVAENFYDICPHCGAWNEYDVSKGKPRLKSQKELHPTSRVSDEERANAKRIKRKLASPTPDQPLK